MTREANAIREVVTVDLKDRGYNIVIGPGVIHELSAFFAQTHDRKIPIITDEHVYAHFHKTIAELIVESGNQPYFIVTPPGEQAKSWRECERIVDELLACGIGRNDHILAFGGGVVGDLAGFAASITKRGCKFVQIPTTLLAQVDSSVGGKTAINTRYGKNLVGAFYQPSAVFIDTSLLTTLPVREIRAGFAEIAKYGLINDAAFFSWLEDHYADVLMLKSEPTTQAISHSCMAKAKIVSKDETEKGERALLNLGHTFGHALEAVQGYNGNLLHGEAVAVGLVAAYRYSADCGLANRNDVWRVEELMKRSGLKTEIRDVVPDGCTAERLMEAMMHDKKNEGKNLVLILARGIGDTFVSRENCTAGVLEFWKKQLERENI